MSAGSQKALYTEADLAEVLDNPEWTAADIAAARTFEEAMPELAAAAKRGRGAQKAPVKELVSVRLDRDVVEKFGARDRDGSPGSTTS